MMRKEILERSAMIWYGCGDYSILFALFILRSGTGCRITQYWTIPSSVSKSAISFIHYTLTHQIALQVHS